MPDSLRAVLLDIDGTLVDSNDAHAESWVEALAGHGHRIPFEEVRRLIGMGGDKLLAATAGISDESPEGRALKEARKSLFNFRYLPALKAFPGVRDLLVRLRDEGLALVVATSSEKDVMGRVLEVAGIADLLPLRTSSGDAENSKPDPDIVGAALKQAGCGPGEAIMLGDTPYDIEAAGKLGISTVAFRCGGWDDANLKDALAVYDGPADLLARFDDSPLARRRRV